MAKKLKELIDEYGLGFALIKIIFKLIYKVLWNIIDKGVFRFLSIKNYRMIFESKPDFSDNGRALYEYLIKNQFNNKYQMIWLVSNPGKYKKYKEKNVFFIKGKSPLHGFHTLKAFYYARTAKYLFFTHSSSWLVRKKEDQLVINLWHGCSYKAAKGKSTDMLFDYVLVPGEIFIETKKTFFNCSKNKILSLGYPRYDWFKSKNPLVEEYLCSLDKGEETNKTILWMPTFRRSKIKSINEETLNTAFDLPIISNMQELKILDEYCSQMNINLVIKKHPFQIEYNIDYSELGNIHLIKEDDLDTKGIQLYELIASVDGLITDYSSVAIDFLLIDKPIGFTLDDYDRYNKSRGFVFENPLKYMPGKHIYNIDDFYEFIKDISRGIDQYKENRTKVREITHNEVEHYCKNILEYFHITKD